MCSVQSCERARWHTFGEVWLGTSHGLLDCCKIPDIGFKFKCTTDTQRTLMNSYWCLGSSSFFGSSFTGDHWNLDASCSPSSRRGDQHPVLVSRCRPLDWQCCTCRIQGMHLTSAKKPQIYRNYLINHHKIYNIMGPSHISHFTSRFSLHWWSLLGMIRYDGFKAFCVGWNRSCLLTSRQHRQSSDLTYRKNLFFWCHEVYWVYWCRYFRLTCLMFSWIATLSSTPFAPLAQPISNTEEAKLQQGHPEPIFIHIWSIFPVAPIAPTAGFSYACNVWSAAESPQEIFGCHASRHQNYWQMQRRWFSECQQPKLAEMIHIVRLHLDAPGRTVRELLIKRISTFF